MGKSFLDCTLKSEEGQKTNLGVGNAPFGFQRGFNNGEHKGDDLTLDFVAIPRPTATCF